MISTLFHEFLTRPLFNGLVFLYNTVAIEDIGIAIILLTVIIRIILYPIFYKSFKNQIILQRIQPEIKKIQDDHKHNRESQAQALLALYKLHNVNPFSGFFLLFLQLPILIALYKVFLTGFSEVAFQGLYSFIHRPEAIHDMFIGLINISESNILIVGLAAVAQYIQGKLSLSQRDPKKELSPAEKIARNMVFIGPVITVIILQSLPAAIGLYWIATSAFSIFQQMLINRTLNYGSLSGPDKKIV
ncbi:MAG: YidC/Oxa1 family membrane protein insertase [Patescibacteria group bacterium]